MDWQAAQERLRRARGATDAALQLGPERARALLDERARLLARPPAEEIPRSDLLKTVTFTISRERCALETFYVRALLPAPIITPVPGAPDVLVGLTHARGSVLAVFELGRLLGLAACAPTDRSWLLVLGAERDELGILADTAEDVEELRIEDLSPPEAIAPGLGGTLVRGVSPRARVVLDGAALLADERLFIAGADPGRGEITDGER